MRNRIRTTLVACAVGVAAFAAAAPGGAGAKPDPYASYPEAKFKVEVKGVQTTYYQRTHASLATCDNDDYSSGDEKVVFETTKPYILQAVRIPGIKEPQILIGRSVTLAARAKVTRRYTQRISQTPDDCGGTGGAQVTPPDCGTKVVPKWKLELKYADTGRDRLELSDYLGHDPFRNCSSPADMGFPFLVTAPTPSRKGKPATAELPASDLFDPKYRKWISIADSKFTQEDPGEYRAQTKVHWEVSFTRLGKH